MEPNKTIGIKNILSITLTLFFYKLISEALIDLKMIFYLSITFLDALGFEINLKNYLNTNFAFYIEQDFLTFKTIVRTILLAYLLARFVKRMPKAGIFVVFLVIDFKISGLYIFSTFIGLLFLVLGGLMADFIASSAKYKNRLKNTLAFGISIFMAKLGVFISLNLFFTDTKQLMTVADHLYLTSADKQEFIYKYTSFFGILETLAIILISIGAFYWFSKQKSEQEVKSN